MERLTNLEFRARFADRTISPIETYKNNKTKIAFECDDCGMMWKATPNNVLHGTGCPHCSRSLMTGRPRRENKVLEDHGDWLLIDISTRKYPAATMKIDAKDWRQIKDSGGVSANTDGYPCQFRDRLMKVHSIVLPRCGGLECDHINRDRSNNRRSNLRLVSHAENIANSGNNPSMEA